MSKFIWLIAGACIVIIAFWGVKAYQGKLPSDTFKNEFPGFEQKHSAQNFQNWREFNSKDGGFTVKLPALPQHATEQQTDPKTHEKRSYDMYVSEADDGTLYMISIIKNLDKPNANIDSSTLSHVMNEMLTSNPEGKVNKMEMSTYKKNPAMDFSIEHKEVNIEGKAFTANGILYVLTQVSKDKENSHSSFDYFANSFNLSPSNTSK